jgi:hypothetical protein
MRFSTNSASTASGRRQGHRGAVPRQRLRRGGTAGAALRRARRAGDDHRRGRRLHRDPDPRRPRRTGRHPPHAAVDQRRHRDHRPGPRRGAVRALFRLEPGKAVYVPTLSPEPERHLDTATVLEALRPILEDPKRPKCGHNMKYDPGAASSRCRAARHRVRLDDRSRLLAASRSSHRHGRSGAFRTHPPRMHPDLRSHRPVGRKGDAAADRWTRSHSTGQRSTPPRTPTSRSACANTWPRSFDEMGMTELYREVEMPLVGGAGDDGSITASSWIRWCSMNRR